MPRPTVPHCADCPYCIREESPHGGYYHYCPIIAPPWVVHLDNPDRGHTSPHDCPRRFYRWAGPYKARQELPHGHGARITPEMVAEAQTAA